MTYRDDLDAAGHRADALAVDLDVAEREKAELAAKLAATERENERLRAQLDAVPPEREPPARFDAVPPERGPPARLDAVPPEREPPAELDVAPHEHPLLRAKLDAASRARLDAASRAPDRVSASPSRDDLDLAGDRRYLRMGVSALGFTLQWTFYLLFPLLGFFATLPVRLAVSERAGLYVLLVIPLAMLGFLVAGQLAIGRAEARVRVWLAAVPFAVEGFYGLFIGSGSAIHRHRFVAKVVFAGAVPAAALEVLATDPLAIEVRGAPPVIELDCDVLGGATPSEAGSYRRLVTSARHLVDDVLIPLHARAPIARLELRPR